MSCGLRLPSPSPSTPTTDQVDGMNCIGPTARSYCLSWSYWPASVSATFWVPLLPVERDAVDAGPGHAVGGQHVAAVAAVVGLDPADGRDERPLDVAGLVGLVDDLRGALVGRESRGRDAVGRGALDELVLAAGRHAGGDLTGSGDVRGLVHRLGRDGAAVGERRRGLRVRRPWRSAPRGSSSRHRTAGPAARGRSPSATWSCVSSSCVVLSLVVPARPPEGGR